MKIQRNLEIWCLTAELTFAFKKLVANCKKNRKRINLTWVIVGFLLIRKEWQIILSTTVIFNYFLTDLGIKNGEMTEEETGISAMEEGPSSEPQEGENQRLTYLHKVIQKNRKEATVHIDASGKVQTDTNDSSFLDLDLGRGDIVHYRFVQHGSRNMSFSFDPAEMVCKCKVQEEHRVLADKGVGGVLQVAPPCFVLSDHNFSAHIHSGEEFDKECVKIIRIENGTLNELVNAWLEVVRGFIVPMGTVVVLCSLSQLGQVGVAAYAEELASMSKRIFDRYGPSLKVVHGVPINGSDMDSMLVRAWHDLDCWLANTSSSGRLTETVDLFNARTKVVIGEMDLNLVAQPTYSVRLKLPCAINRCATNIFQMDGINNLAKVAPKMNSNEVATLQEALIKELNGKFPLNLGFGEVQASRIGGSSLEEDITEHRDRVVLVGGSHSRRLAEVMKEMDIEVVEIIEPGLIFSVEKAEEMGRRLSSILEKEVSGNTLIVYQVLDNTCYQQGKDQDWGPMEKGPDGKYHAEGQVRVTRVKDLCHLFRPLTVLMRIGGGHRKLLIAPMERYLSSKCCEDLRHMTNWTSDFVPDMSLNLGKLRVALSDHLHSRNVRNWRVCSIMKLLGLDSSTGEDSRTGLRKMWEEDPVHLSGTAYAILGEAVYDMLVGEGTEFRNQKKEQKDRKDNNRPDWLREDCTGEAGPRRRDRSWSGGASASGGWSGGGGGRGWSRGGGPNRGRARGWFPKRGRFN